MASSTDYTRDGTLILKNSVAMPKVLDMLIVGGGPAGIGAAFRAQELGLSALVIDYDDLMKQIRDYPKNKKIKPDYGAADKMKFPRCGELIGLLRFEESDKDELCERWKGFFRDRNVPAQIGLELIEIERQPDGVLKARLYNSNTKAEQFLFARHIILAMGNGSPRPFDIPGNTKDIAYRLADAEKYVNGPVLVIGSGTSAAEAVIAVSNAKNDKEDTATVYWSYRSKTLPKVSKALADEYFTAFMENGNISTFPKSEPVAVITAEDGREYLSIRTDRQFTANRPNETIHLEFPKANCIACIGQEIPESFLNKLGIPLVLGGPSQGGPDKKKRPAVTPLLESQQPNIYLIGSMLGTVYLEAVDFTAAPATFQEKKSGGNIKAALTDGVFVTEVIKQKIDGQTAIQVALDFYDEPEDQKDAPLPIASPIDTIMEPSAPEAAPAARRAALVRISANDMEVDRFPLKNPGLTRIGRSKDCDIPFPNDTALADQHASISCSPDGYFLRDDGSRFGVFLRLRPNQLLEVVSGDIVQLGKQFLLFRVENENYYFVHYDLDGRPVNRYALKEETMELGRGGNTVLDSNDFVLSRRHLAVTRRANRIFVQDVGSANGTFLKVKNSAPLETEDEFRVGQQALKFILSYEETRYSGATIFKTPPSGLAAIKTSLKPPPPAAEKPAPRIEPAQPPPRVEPAQPAVQPVKVEPPAAAAKPEAQGAVVVFQNFGKTCPIEKRQTIYEVAKKFGITLKVDCGEGTCGSDPIRIISGGENLKAANDTEKSTLVEKNNLTPGECRLACVAKYSGNGPVVVEIIESKG